LRFFSQIKLSVKKMRIYVPIILAVLVAGCSTASPTLQEGADAEVSFDGLVKIDNARFAAAWADPDVDFSRYSKVLPGGAAYEFRDVDKGSQSLQNPRSRSSQDEFWISDADREKLVEVTTEIFAEELAKSTRFEVTDSRGSDVLILRGALHDIVSKVPPDLIGRGEIYLSSVGEVTIIVEALDSLSGEVVFRGLERREAGTTAGAMRSSSVTTWAEVRRLIRRWASTLVDGLDSLPDGE
jgi:hypothetical protein